MNVVCLDHHVPLLHQQAGRNECGPCSAAMAAGFYDPSLAEPYVLARLMRFLRVPWLGATLPWAVPLALCRLGLRTDGGWFQNIHFVRNHVNANHPVVVIVKPTDLAPCPWYALHYRVVVGYFDDPAVKGGGAMLFNCSAAPGETASGMRSPESPATGRQAADASDIPGNTLVDYATFQRQWRTYLTINWAVAVLPGAPLPAAGA